MNITAFERRTEPVQEHDEIEGAITEPVRVLHIDSYGARLENPVEGTHFVVYDLLQYDEIERVEYNPVGFIQAPGETDPELWTQTFTKNIVIDAVPRRETYAVAVN